MVDNQISQSDKGVNERKKWKVGNRYLSSSLEEYLRHMKIPVENYLKGIQNSNDGPLI